MKRSEMTLVPQTLSYVSEDDPSRIYDQMWECTRCHNIRQWGIGPTPAPKERPLLTCSCQPDATRHVAHVFAGLLPPPVFKEKAA